MGPADFAALSFSTNMVAARERTSYWREAFGRQIVRVDFEPDRAVPLEASCVLRAMQGLRTVSLELSASRTLRPRRLLADDDDALALLMPAQGKLTASQRDRELTISAGDAALVLNEEAAAVRHATVRYESILVPRSAIAPLVKDIEEAAVRPLMRGEALRLLTTYMKTIQEDLKLESPALRSSVVSHVQDLLALVIGATRDGTEIAKQRGLQAARLAAVKSDVMEHVGQRDLTLTDVAARQGLAPRQIQRLFEAAGATFSTFVLEHKLARAHRMLADPRYSGSTISAIAFAAGFGDLSYFHRVYRQRYGATPAETRNDARDQNRAN